MTWRIARSKSVRLSMHIFGAGGGFGGDSDRWTAYPVARSAAIFTSGGAASAGITARLLSSNAEDMAARVGRMQSAAAMRVLLHVTGGSGGEIVVVAEPRRAWLRQCGEDRPGCRNLARVEWEDGRGGGGTGQGKGMRSGSAVGEGGQESLCSIYRPEGRRGV